jgi:hypothetical protein
MCITVYGVFTLFLSIFLASFMIPVKHGLSTLPVGETCYNVYIRTRNVKRTTWTRKIRNNLSHKQLEHVDLIIKHYQCQCFDFGNPLSVEYFLDCHTFFPDLDNLYRLWEISKTNLTAQN